MHVFSFDYAPKDGGQIAFQLRKILLNYMLVFAWCVDFVEVSFARHLPGPCAVTAAPTIIEHTEFTAAVSRVGKPREVKLGENVMLPRFRHPVLILHLPTPGLPRTVTNTPASPQHFGPRLVRRALDVRCTVRPLPRLNRAPVGLDPFGRVVVEERVPTLAPGAS